MNLLVFAEKWIRSVLVPAAQLVLWLFLYLSLLLGGWVFLGWSLGGWSPVVVTSGSMEPTLSVGDVLLIDTDPGDSVAQRSIIVFDRDDGELIVHRVFAVEETAFVTKGDANAAPDVNRVNPASIAGEGRLVVPLIGLPAVWGMQGNQIALFSWLVLSAIGVTHLLVLGFQRLRSGATSSSQTPDDVPIAQLGIRRVRTLVALLIAAQYLLDSSRFEVLIGSTHRLLVLLASLGVLFTTNLVSAKVSSRVSRSSHIRLVLLTELAVDTMLVVLLNTLTGTDGIGWVLFALPIIEAAVSFRLVGALAHWMVLTVITVSARIWTAQIGTTVNMLEDLESVLDQLSVLFLVVVPGAYLAEQLMGDVAAQQRATRRALERGNLLEQVAEAGREVSRLGGEHLRAIVEGAERLGFDAVDVLIGDEGDWTKLGGDPDNELPQPGRYGSGLRPADLAHQALVIDENDTDRAEFLGLAQAGFQSLVVQTVSTREGERVVLRTAVRSGYPLSTALIDAVRLLANQGSVALRNDELLGEVTSMQDELAHRAHHDLLTQLPNRVLLLQELQKALASPDTRPALLFLDLDRFKPVNDRLGHEAGDALLQLVGRRLLNLAPADSIVARVGGDEFTILIPGTVSDGEALAVAEQVWKRLGEPFQLGGNQIQISASVGVAFGESGTTESELIRQADVAMYEAKRGPESQFCQVYRPEFDHPEERRAVLVAGISTALRFDQLELAYQPVFSVSQQPSIVGFEALLRWNHPTFGWVPPPEIVEVAQGAQVRDELHRWISLQACSDAAAWAEKFPDLPFFMAINASPDELASQSLVTNINAALLTSKFPAQRLFVEISERLIAPDAPAIVRNMAALSSIGVRMLLDDFGEGQTSISYIHELPVSGIKLDRRLVVNALRSPTDQIVLDSIVDLCHRLNLVVIAEGVETADHLNAIAKVGSNMAQGYFLGRPQSASSVIAHLSVSYAPALGGS